MASENIVSAYDIKKLSYTYIRELHGKLLDKLKSERENSNNLLTALQKMLASRR